LNLIRYFYKEENSILVLSSRFFIKRERKMKKFLFILFIFVFASSASAAVYKWVDERGVVNYTDDYSKVPPDDRNKVEEVSISRIGPSSPSRTPLGNMSVGAQSGNKATQAPLIAQPLTREGDFAIKLVEALKVGQAKSEAEAESILASVGIAPKNGWIADYPITPDIAEELQNAISQAADSKRLSLSRDEALIAFQGLTAERGLSVVADTRGEVVQNEPPADYGQYSNPDMINNYYYNEGPPVVTYYPPPWDYSYMYAWVPYPFWCSGFWFSGFFILNDFHRPIYGHGGPCFVSNHYRDHGSQRVHTVDPVMRHRGREFRGEGDLSHGRGFHSAEARKGAASIYGRSYERSGHGNAPNGANSTRPGGRFQAGHSANRGNSPAASNSRTRGSERPSATWGNRGEVGPHGSGGRPSSQQKGFEGHSRTPSTGGNRSFIPPSTGSRSPSGSSSRAPSVDGNRSFSLPSGGVGRSFTSPSTGSRGPYGGSSRASQGGGRSGGFGGSHGGGHGGGDHGGGSNSGGHR
jgi:hypothetical protein